MNKKLWLCSFIIIIVTLLTGCFGSSPPPPPNYPETEQKTAQVVSAFESEVESYDVAGMLGCLSGADFKLTIREASFSIPKLYSTLETELVADEANQLAWRQPVTEPNGHAYKLDLVLGELDYSNTTDSGTCAQQTFEVWESADGIPSMKTDKGNIIWKVVENSGKWQATEMTIEYQALSGSGFSAMQVATGSKGFGFSKLISR